jgi:NAD(P)-dependent dehydrogenase (short-subunit alcohol dehydrogenase family)
VSATSAWLAGKRGLVAGSGPILVEITAALRRNGATVVDGPRAATDDFEGSLVDAEAALGGPVDLLVHGGASIDTRASEATSLEQWRAGVSADLDSRFLQTAAFARRCIAVGRPGSILYLLPSRRIAAGRVGQATSLGALCNLIKSLAVEWARDGIRINGIASQACEEPESVEPVVRTSLGNLSAYVLSDYAAYITGMVTGISEFSAGTIGLGVSS